MAAFENFLDRINEAGIQILNERALTTNARWASNERLAEILNGCIFTPVEARAVINSAMPASHGA